MEMIPLTLLGILQVLQVLPSRVAILKFENEEYNTAQMQNNTLTFPVANMRHVCPDAQMVVPLISDLASDTYVFVS